MKLVYSGFLILVFTLNQVKSEQSNATTTDEELACPSKCEDCGNRVVRCILSLSKCRISCECREGFSGPRCEFVDMNELKKKVWSEIMDESRVLISFSAYQSMVKRLSDLVTVLIQDNQFESSDMDKLGVVFSELHILNELRSYPNGEKVLESLLNILDMVVNCSAMSSLEDNWMNSTRVVFEKIDRLGKYFNRDEPNRIFRMKFKSFEALVNEISGSSEDWIEMRSSQIEEMDSSISFSRKALNSLLPDSKHVRVVFKIYDYLMVI